MKDERKGRRFGDQLVDHSRCCLFYGKKKRGRIRYLNWVTEFYGCWDEKIEGKILPKNSEDNLKENHSPSREVREAVKKLPSAEKRFIELFYFDFKTYQQIAMILKKKIYKLERIHQRALGKLRILLADFVRERFKLDVPENTDCIICRSPFRKELDQLIKNKKKEETYARLIKLFKRKYQIDIKTPQVIIGHKKKHMV